MAEYRKSFILYAELIHTVRKMPKDKVGELFLTILEYVNDENPIINDVMIDVVFEPIKRQLIYQKNIVPSGVRHWNYKGGISPLNSIIRNGLDIKYWRLGVFKRDKYTCQHCGQVGGILHAHHIKEFAKYPDLRFDVNNGLTLCKGCHINVHKKVKKLSTTL